MTWGWCWASPPTSWSWSTAPRSQRERPPPSAPIRGCLTPTSERNRGAMLTLDDVWCAYGPITAVLSLSLEAASGALVCILGANGAGKSTTLGAIAGLVRPRRGRIIFDGKDITALGAPQRVALGITLAPEGRRIFTEFTVEQNLWVGGHQLSRREAVARIGAVTALFPILRERLKQPAGLLSGGEQQMRSEERRGGKECRSRWSPYH